MKKHNPKNERIKRNYLRFLKESKGQNELSLDSAAMALSQFESYTKHRDFKKFHYEQAIGFKHDLAKQKAKRSGKPLSKSTLNTILRYLKGFVQWLAMQPGYKSSIIFTHADYFSLSEKDARIANTSHARPPPTLDQAIHVIKSMPCNTDIERRDQAIIAFILLTGARDSAVASMKIKHVDIENSCVYQDAREVNTKFSKTFTTRFLPVGNDIHEIFIEWVNYLQLELHWNNEDPLFPKTKLGMDNELKFKAIGLERENWKTANSIRGIFKKAFLLADLPYFHPHSFRKTLARLGLKKCRTPEEFKAWSQSLGHNDVLTTLMSYGEISLEQQGELIHNLSLPEPEHDDDAIIKLAEAVLKRSRN